MGKVVDEKNQPLASVVVDDGSIGVTTDNLGYYEISTDSNFLNFRYPGYITQKVDLSKYPKDSSVNVNVNMVSDEASLKQLDIGVDKTNRRFVIGAIVGGLFALGGYHLAKRYTKSIPAMIGGAMALGIGGYFTGLKFSDYISKTIDKKRV